MSYSFHDLNENRNHNLHRQSVWNEVIEHLSKFLDTDAEPAKMGIATKGEGLTVPQDVITDVLDHVHTTVDGFQRSIDELEQTLMEDRNVSEKQTRRKEGTKGSQRKEKEQAASKAKGHRTNPKSK